MKTERIDLKTVILGKEEMLISRLANPPASIFSGKHQSCPRCGGETRFRVVKKAGFIVGYFCGNERGDVIGMIAHFKKSTYFSVCREIEDELGLNQLTDEQKKINKEENRLLKIKIAKQQAIVDAKIIANYNIVACKAAKIWESSCNANPEHSYLKKKKITGLMLRQKASTLLVPVTNIKNELRGVQKITDSYKGFLGGQQVTGNFCFIGHRLKDRPLLFCEGYATGETIHNLTGLPVVVCFNSNNVPTVVKIFKDKLPDQTLMLMADDDYGKWLEMKARGSVPQNAGNKTVAECRLLEVKSLQPLLNNDEKFISDWNDVYVNYGKIEFLRQIRHQYKAHN